MLILICGESDLGVIMSTDKMAACLVLESAFLLQRENWKLGPIILRVALVWCNVVTIIIVAKQCTCICIYHIRKTHTIM